jgi:hypothetical protein
MPDNKQPIGTDFVFRVEGIKLSVKDQERISQAISAAVSGEMLKLAKPANDLAIIRPFPWPGGIWIKGIRDLKVFDRVATLAKMKPKVGLGG